MSTADEASSAAGPPPATPRRRPPTCSTRSSPPPGPRTTPEAARQGLLPPVPRPGRQARPGRLQGRRDQHQVLDRRDRQEALGPAQRGPAPPRLPAARIDLARAALPRPPERDRRDAQDPRPQRHASRSCSRTWRRPPSSIRARCSRRSTRRSTASSAAQPYGMLVGDYEFGRTAEDISLLKMISNVAAAAHAPFVAAASPKMFNFDSFTELAEPARPGQDLRQRRVRRLEVVPRVGGLALRRA